jgi:cardiolipin synthase (CMP-forming)
MARRLRATGAPLMDWSELRTVPNALTALRIALVPVFLVSYLAGDLRLAVAVFLAAAVTDIADGTLARLLRQRTSLGAFLDPVADKLLAVTALAALVAHRRLPAWLLALALLRDAVVLTLLLLARHKGIPLAGASPSRLGKYATFFTAVAVLLALADEIWQPEGLAAYVLASAMTAGECLAAASLQYVWRFARRLRKAGAA